MEKEMAMEPAEAPRQKNRILMAIVGVVMTLAMLFSIGATLPAQTVNAGPIGGILVAADERRTTDHILYDPLIPKFTPIQRTNRNLLWTANAMNHYFMLIPTGISGTIVGYPLIQLHSATHLIVRFVPFVADEMGALGEGAVLAGLEAITLGTTALGATALGATAIGAVALGLHVLNTPVRLAVLGAPLALGAGALATTAVVGTGAALATGAAVAGATALGAGALGAAALGAGALGAAALGAGALATTAVVGTVATAAAVGGAALLASQLLSDDFSEETTEDQNADQNAEQTEETPVEETAPAVE